LDYVLIAGGGGISIIRSMLGTLAKRRDGRSHILFLADSTLEKLTFYEELPAMQEAHLNIVSPLKQPPLDWQEEQVYKAAGN